MRDSTQYAGRSRVVTAPLSGLRERSLRDCGGPSDAGNKYEDRVTLVGNNTFSSVILPRLARCWRRGVEGSCLWKLKRLLGGGGAAKSPLICRTVTVKVHLQCEAGNKIKSESARTVKRSDV